MKFIKTLFSKKDLDSRLFGVWLSENEFIESNEDIEIVKMTFNSAGELIYEIITQNKTQIIFMIYETKGNIIISEQPSSPHKELTKFEFENNESILVLEFEGKVSRFVKETRFT